MKKTQLIDLLRTFSILTVLTIHIYLTGILNVPGTNPSARVFFEMFARNGTYGVLIFFVISGFLITGLLSKGRGGLLNPDFQTFYARRIGRIVPLLVLVCLIGTVNILAAAPDSPAFDFCYKNAGSKLNLTFLLSVFTFTFNSFLNFPHNTDFGYHWRVLWSLSIEEQFYLFFPFVLKRLKTERNLYFFLAFFIALGPVVRWITALFTAEGEDWIPALANSFCFFDQIALGALLFLVFQRYGGRLKKTRFYSVALCGAGAALMTWVFLNTSMGDNAQRIYSFSLLGIGTFLFLLGGLNLDFFESGKLRLFALPGKLSYGMYLLHITVIYLMWPVLAGKSLTLGFGLLVLAATCFSWVSFTFYEVPLKNYIQNRFSRKTSPKK